MDLKDFVKEVLKNITEAVEESKNDKFSFALIDSTDEGISFDLAITLKENANGKIGAEIFSVLGAKAEGGISQEKVNRISFKVLPQKIGEEYTPSIG